MGARDYNFQWLFATVAQAAYGTAVADASLTKSAFIQGPDLAKRVPLMKKNSEQFGMGHEWPTAKEILGWDLTVQRNFDLTSLLAGWFAAYGLGVCTSTQPDSVGNPLVYSHAITPIVPTVTVQQPSASIIEQPANAVGQIKKIRDLIVSKFSFSGSGQGRVQLKSTLKGSGFWANSSVAMVAPTAAKFLHNHGLKFELGVYGGGLTDLSASLKEWSFEYDNDNENDKDGYFPGSGLYRGRHEVGVRKISFPFKLLVAADGQETDRLENQTTLALTLTITGETISTTYKHSMIISLPKIEYEIVDKIHVDKRLLYDIKPVIYYDSTVGVVTPVKITVQNDVASYL